MILVKMLPKNIQNHETQRICLMCDKPFASMGNYNRRCKKCEPEALFVAKLYNTQRSKTTDGSMSLVQQEYSDEGHIRFIMYGDPTERI
mgnify:FL=1